MPIQLDETDEKLPAVSSGNGVGIAGIKGFSCISDHPSFVVLVLTCPYEKDSVWSYWYMR